MRWALLSFAPSLSIVCPGALAEKHLPRVRRLAAKRSGVAFGVSWTAVVSPTGASLPRGHSRRPIARVSVCRAIAAYEQVARF